MIKRNTRCISFTRPILASLAVLMAASLQAPAWSSTPETARELRKQRAQRNLEANKNNLQRKARDAELPEMDAAVIEEYTRMIDYIGDAQREGRAPGTQGIKDAAKFIENELTLLGLEPAFSIVETTEDDVEIITKHATFRQAVPIGYSLNAAVQTMSVNGDALIEERDFAPLAYSGSTDAQGEVVFTGYSVVSGPGSYLGFGNSENFDGKIAMCLKYEPMDDQGNSLWKDEGWSHHSRLTYKISALERRGAEAVLIVSVDGANDNNAGMLDTIGSTSPPAGVRRGNRGGPKFDIPVLSITPEVAQEILDQSDAGLELDELIRRANTSGVVEEISGSNVEVSVEIERTETFTDNVGALLPGRGGLADEYVVIGAHYDHVGYGHFGSRGGHTGIIHPGADDNASGTSGVILAAKRLSERYAQLAPEQDARSVLFLLFTAEESGLNGSRFYADNPIASIDQHTIMLNMDMIGRLESDPLEIGGFESSKELDVLATYHLDQSGMVYDRNTSVGKGRSDHASFENKDIPNMFFFTGLHDDYHTPDDTLDKIDIQGAARIAMTVSDIAFGAAVTSEPFIHSSQRGTSSNDDQGNEQPKVRIGIIPADSTQGGILIQRVFDETSASNAGLQQYDRVTHWNGSEIKSVDSWSPVLLKHEPGDVVKLTVDRGGDVIEVEMTLKGIE
jgi:Peptidase family M28/PDZ domain